MPVNTTTIQLKGMKELAEMLKKFPEDFQKKTLRAALRDGAKVVQAEAVDKAPEDTGLLKAGIKVSTQLKGDYVISRVRTTGKHAYLGNWLEHGTAAHEIMLVHGIAFPITSGVFSEKIQHPGTPPRPFMRPALETKTSDAINAVAARIQKTLKKGGRPEAMNLDVGVDDDDEKVTE